MGLALTLLFDAATSGAVQRVWQGLVDAKLSSGMLELGYPAHLSLLVIDDDAQRHVLVQALPELAAMSPRNLVLERVATFPQTDVVYIGCGGDLTRLHALHVAAAARVPLTSIQQYYRPESWTPHVTLQTIGDAARSSRLAADLWPRSQVATVARLEVVTFPPVRSVQAIEVR